MVSLEMCGFWIRPVLPCPVSLHQCGMHKGDQTALLKGGAGKPPGPFAEASSAVHGQKHLFRSRRDELSCSQWHHEHPSWAAGVWQGWKGPGWLCWAGAGVAGGESLFGWSCGNHAAGTGAEKVLTCQMRRSGCVVFRKAADLRL